MVFRALIGRLGDPADRAPVAIKCFGAKFNWWVGAVRGFHPTSAAANLSSMIRSAWGAAADSVGGGGGSAQSAANAAKMSFSGAGGAEQGTAAVSFGGGLGPRRSGLMFLAMQAAQGRVQAVWASGPP